MDEVRKLSIAKAIITTLDFVADALSSNCSNSTRIDVLDAAYRMVHDMAEGPTRHVALKILNYHLDRLWSHQDSS